MLLSGLLLVLPVMTFPCRTSALTTSNKSKVCQEASNACPKTTQPHSKTTQLHLKTIGSEEKSRSSKTQNATKLKSLKGKRNGTRRRRLTTGLTTRTTPHIGQGVGTPVSDAEFYMATSDIFAKMSGAEDQLQSMIKRRDAALKKLQENMTGFFTDLPFPFTEDGYIHGYDTLKQEGFTLWKNATRDFTELRRVYVAESRSLHVAEAFTAYRRRGTHFYTVLGIEGWDGNIFEYPEWPYRYRSEPSSQFSIRTCEVETRDPRVLPFTVGESRLDLKPRYRHGRYGEWVIDFPNETYISAGPERIHWPLKWRESDPDNMTIPMYNWPTFARKRRRRRGVGGVRCRRSARNGDHWGTVRMRGRRAASTVKMRRQKKRSLVK